MLTKEQAEFIRINAPKMTIKELSKATNKKPVALYSYLHKYNIPFLYEFPSMERRQINIPEDEPKRPIQRPPAVYSNHSPFGIAS